MSMTNQQWAPEALRHADGLESFARMLPAYGFDPQPLKDAAATVRSLHAIALELADQLSGKNERLAALVEAQQPAPSAAVVVNPDPHAELRKTWQPGQRWQARSFRNGQWGPWTDAVASEPFWFPHQDYRRHPDDLAPQPSPTPQADSQPAPVLDRDRIREIFMAHGFTVKEGQTDLKQYVYDAADALLRAARAPADSGAAPAGWKLVPIEPSVDQEWEGKEASSRVSTMAEACKIYKAMLAAAPTPPAQAADSVLEDAALLQEARTALWQPANVDLCERIDVYLDAARKQGGAT